VLLVGSQAVGTGTDIGQLVSAIERLGIPTYLSGMARGLLGASHQLQYRHQRKQALREADVVVLAGTPCDFRLDYGRQINRHAFLVSVNQRHADVVRNRRPDIGVACAPDRFIVTLASVATWRRGNGGWLSALASRESARSEEIDRQAATASGVNPLALCQAIDRQLGHDSIVIADGGDFVATASYIVRPRTPLSWLDPGVFGTLGVGAGFILGAHASRPGAELWALFGDGALGFSLAEFDTLVRHCIPVVAVVGNDGKWAQIARDQEHVLGDGVGTRLGRSAYHEVVAGFGARGFLLDDATCMDATLAAAREAARKGIPVLVNAMIADTDFRKGSISL
jgi:acetolactate synthase-1/2/3 large subunit